MKKGHAVALLSVFGLAAAASADQVDMAYTGVGHGKNIQFSINNANYTNAFSGQIHQTISNASDPIGLYLEGPQNTFCIELTQHVSSSAQHFDIVPFADSINPYTNAPEGAARAQALADLFEMMGDDARSATADDNFASAFQIVVWEIVYDFAADTSSINPGAGVVKVTNMNASPLAAGIASAIDVIKADMAAHAGMGDTGKLYALMNGNAQNQVVYVPTPGVAAIGLLGFGALGRRRRHS